MQSKAAGKQCKGEQGKRALLSGLQELQSLPHSAAPSLSPGHRADLTSSAQPSASLPQPCSPLPSSLLLTIQLMLLAGPTSWDTISESLCLHKSCRLFMAHPGFPSYRKPTKISFFRKALSARALLKAVLHRCLLLITHSAPGLFYMLGIHH